jgi:tripartite-type tricarboxylate transporter receptor subunit TctC
VHSIADLVRYAKEHPGQLSYGSTGTGAAPHLAGEMLKSMTGIEMTHVPYRGSIPALTDVIANNVQLTFTDPAIAPPQIADGKVRALGVSSLTRVPVLPDVPPLAEAGVPGFEAVSWHMIVAPRATLRAVIDRLHAELAAVIATPELQQRIAAIGLIPVESPPPDALESFLASEMGRWGALVRQVGIAGSE